MKKRRWMALALACTMIFTAGCQKGGKETAEVPDNQETKESQTETAKTEFQTQKILRARRSRLQLSLLITQF